MSDRESKDMDGAASKNNFSSETANNVTKKKSTYIVIGLLVIIIIALAIIIYFLFPREKEDIRDMVVTEDNVEDIQEELEKAAADAYYETSMTTDWTFENATAASKDAFVENPSSNSRTVYFDVNLSDSDELVYSSPYIPVGKSLKGFALSKKLKKGDYPAVVTYHLVDDEKEEVADVSVGVTLHILN